MAVPTPSNPAVRNTTGGSFVAQQQGCSFLGNTNVVNVITKALALKDNAADFINMLPKALANGLVSSQKVLAGGSFAYSVAGKYVVRTISDTLSGVSSNAMLIPSSAINSTQPIAKFRHDFGADTTSLMRKNRFTRTGFFNNGNKVSSRVLWLNAAGTAVATPSTLTGGFMYDIADGNATNMAADSAAEPTRAVPGELVMKVDFVTLTVASGGDFFDYKPITGM